MFHKVTLSIIESAELDLLPIVLVFWNSDWVCLLFGYQEVSFFFWRTKNSFHLGKGDVFLHAFLDNIAVLAKENFFKLFELTNLSLCAGSILKRVAQPHTWLGGLRLHIITGEAKLSNRAYLGRTWWFLHRSLDTLRFLNIVSHERSSLVNLNFVQHF